MSDNRAQLKKLYQALKDEPISPDSPYYEPFLSGMKPDPIEELRTRINFAESESLHLVTGQRGTGKSTELRRLHALLEKDSFIVFRVDIKDYLELTEPVEISDFLISTMLSLADKAKEQCGLEALRESYWERLRNFLSSEVRIEGMEAKTGILDFKASLRMDTSFKQRLQKAAKGHVAKLVADAHQFVTELVTKLRQETGPDQAVAFIIDSLEQLRPGSAAITAEVYDSVVRLFNTYGKDLLLPQMHVVITVPPYLIPSAPDIARYIGGNPVTTLPSVHVRTPDGEIDSEGIKTLRAILGRRSERAEEIFPETVASRLAEASGGNLRDLFRLLRDCLVKASTGLTAKLPIDESTVSKAIDALRREMLPIADDGAGWLAKIHRTKRAELENKAKDLPRLAWLFDGNLLLHYRNGRDWYDVHPLILERVEQTSSGPSTQR